MPELPEVEALARRIRPRVAGERIVDVAARVPKSINLPLPELRAKSRQRVLSVGRRAKYVVFGLEEGALWLHLGLTAEPSLQDDGASIAEAALGLAFGNCLALVIKSTFMGRMDYYAAADNAKKWEEFGAEPLDQGLDVVAFRRIVEQASRQAVKALLMDQATLAGIGNVYSDEILYAACIHPARKAGSLSAAEVEELYRAMRDILQQAVDEGGELKWPGLGPGLGHYETRVHGRETCRGTGEPTETIKIGSRTAYYCPSCQKP